MKKILSTLCDSCWTGSKNLCPKKEDVKMTRASRDFSYLHQILDEICLEGLDGITLQVTLATPSQLRFERLSWVHKCGLSRFVHGSSSMQHCRRFCLMRWWELCWTERCSIAIVFYDSTQPHTFIANFNLLRCLSNHSCALANTPKTYLSLVNSFVGTLGETGEQTSLLPGAEWESQAVHLGLCPQPRGC